MGGPMGVFGVHVELWAFWLAFGLMEVAGGPYCGLAAVGSLKRFGLPWSTQTRPVWDCHM